MRCLLLYIICNFLHAATCQRPGPKCGEGTFACSDASCIPNEWLCDQDADCKQGDDETQELCTQIEAQRFQTWNSQQPGQQEETLPSIPVPPTVSLLNEAPQEQIVLDYEPGWGGENAPDVPPQPPIVIECTPGNETIVKECQSYLLAWLAKYGMVDPNVPLFTSDDNIEIMREGCNMYKKFTDCLGPLYHDPAGCLPESALNAWDHFEAFTCQLLIPTADNYETCWNRLKDHSCFDALPKIPENHQMANYCLPIVSVNRVLLCGDAVECDDNAKQVLSAVKAETAIFNSQYTCLPDLAGETPMIVTDPSLPSDPNCPAPALLGPCVSQLTILNQGSTGFTPESILSPQTPVVLKQICALYGGIQSCAANLGTDLKCVANAAGSDLPPWSALLSVLCEPTHIAGLNVNQACIQSVQQSGGLSDCQPSGTAIPTLTSCATVDRVVKFFDCTLPLIDEVCSVSSVGYFSSLQGSLADRSIDLDCFNEGVTAKPKSGFQLTPSYAQCSDDQETSALGCLLSLLELAEVFENMEDQDLLLEISAQNSPLVNKVCSLYGEYSDCLYSDVFEGGQRCSFTAPLNSMARVGLDPFCDPETQKDMRDNRQCMLKLSNSPSFGQCSGRLGELGPMIQDIVEGGGPEILCRIFYMIREIFDCLKAPIEAECGPKTLDAMDRARTKITKLGVEEGCPADAPPNFDQYFTPAPLVPIPIDITETSIALPAPVEDVDCVQKQQACLLPMLAFQPHPISVLDAPRNLQPACTAYDMMEKCTGALPCSALPNTASLSTMFNFMCKDTTAFEGIKQHGRCLRRLSSRADVKQCVQTSMNASQTSQACDSAQQLVECSLHHVSEKCGAEAAELTYKFGETMVKTLDSTCRLSKEKAKPPASGFQCSASEEQVITECSTDLIEITKKVKALFNKGLTAFLGNQKQLVNIFTEGCSIGNNFKTCVHNIQGNKCQVASCLVKSGDGICNQTDKGTVIQAHLKCIFGMLADKRFARCLASSFKGVNLKDLNQVQRVLPTFINCIEEPLTEKCGVVPVNILRSFASDPEKCVLPVGDLHPNTLISVPEPEPEPIPSNPPIIADFGEPKVEYVEEVQVVPSQPNVIRVNEEACAGKQEAYVQCLTTTVAKPDGGIEFQPVSLLTDASKLDEACELYAQFKQCLSRAAAEGCGDAKGNSVAAVMETACGRERVAMDKHAVCMSDVLSRDEPQKCLNAINSVPAGTTNFQSEFCAALQESTNCAARHINRNCHEDAVMLSYDLMNDFVTPLNPSCRLDMPVFLASSGCTAAEMNYYKQCEDSLNFYEPQPFSFIAEADLFPQFCVAFNQDYLSCISSLNCLPEPVVSAQKRVYEYLCNAPLKNALYKKHGQCLSQYASSAPGRKCMKSWKDMTIFGPQAGDSVCNTVRRLLDCASSAIREKCGFDALLFVHDLHTLFAQQFKPDCAILPQTEPEPEPEVHPETHPEPHPEGHEHNHDHDHEHEHDHDHDHVHVENVPDLLTRPVTSLPPLQKTTPSKKPVGHADAIPSQKKKAGFVNSCTLLSLIMPLLLSLRVL